VEEAINQSLDTPYQLQMPAKHITRTEVHATINRLRSNKSPGYDLITGQILKALPPTGLQFLTQLFNAAFTLGYFPAQWKVAQIILLLKPGKPPHELTSYRPISLLPIVSKVFEKILLPIVGTHKNIPDHQFGFRKRHSTIKQTHRVVRKIHEAFETKQYCSAAFLDISQAFNKMWHTGLQYKIRQILPLNYFLLIKSYLQNRHFLVKIANEYSHFTPINAGVPQGSVLGPLLYVLYSADLPTSDGTFTATFADDTAILTTDSDPIVASQLLQTNPNLAQNMATKSK
jgi:hypothetical protein